MLSVNSVFKPFADVEKEFNSMFNMMETYLKSEEFKGHSKSDVHVEKSGGTIKHIKNRIQYLIMQE